MSDATTGTQPTEKPNGHDNQSPWNEHDARIKAGELFEHRKPFVAKKRALPKWPKPFPGLMTQAVDACLEASNKPRPIVAMGAVLTGMAGAIPPTYCLNDGMRLNLFTNVSVDPSGGKDTPRVVAAAIADAAGAVTEGIPASGAALEKMLANYVSMMLPVDESARMQGAQKDRGAQHYSKDLIDVLLKLFSASRTHYSTRAYADSKRSDARRRIWHPSINLLMFGTDYGVARSLDEGSIRTGELPRQLFIHDNVPVPHRRAPMFVMPEAVRGTAQKIGLTPTERAVLHEDGGGEKPDMHCVIRETEQAGRVLDIVMARHDGKDAHGGNAPLGITLASRHFEKVLRVAGVLAVWDDPLDPCITARHVAWAEAFVTACDVAMSNYYATEVHENQHAADVQRVRRALADALEGKGGRRIAGNAKHIEAGNVPRPLVQYLANSMGKRQFDDAVATLESLGEVVAAKARLGQRPGEVLLRGEAWEG